MSQISPIACAWLSALALLYCLPGLASTVYRTVDENGVVSFSDTRPEGAAGVETLQIDAQDPQLTAQDTERLEAMRETTDRMAADRREREKHRAEMRQLQATTQPQPGHPQPDYADYMGSSSSYSSGHSGYHGYPPRRPGRPGRPNRPGYNPYPGHPIVRPPLRPMPHPTAQVNRGSNAQLMRPIVSPRR